MKMLIYQQTKTNLLMAHERTEPEIIEMEGVFMLLPVPCYKLPLDTLQSIIKLFVDVNVVNNNHPVLPT